MRSFNVLPKLFSLTSALIIHYHMWKKSQKNFCNYALCRAAFIHCSRCVNYNESTAVRFDMIIEIFNWVSADHLCVRTDRCWKEWVPPGHRRARQYSDGSICYTMKPRWDFFYYWCRRNKLLQSNQTLCTLRCDHYKLQTMSRQIRFVQCSAVTLMACFLVVSYFRLLSTDW